MAKLYVEVSSENTATRVSKGGNEMIRMELKRGNEYSYYIYFTEKDLMITKHGKDMPVFVDRRESK